MSYLQDAGRIILGAETYIIHNDRVLLHKRATTKKTFPGFWIGPGGHIDSGEDALTAAIREVYEESGVRITPDTIRLKAVAFHHHTDRNELYMLFIFRADIAENQPVSLPSNEGMSQWIPLEDVPSLKNLFPASAYYFDHVLNDKPGILYTSLELENAEVKTVKSSTTDQSA